MASRLGESDQDLHHFVSHNPWSVDLLLEGLAKTTAAAAPADWIIDETSFPKAGSHSAGVQRQYCGALGEKANCQLAVSLHRADEAAGTSQPFGWRLFLPESWADDPARCQRAGIPPGIVHQSKLDLALELIDFLAGLPPSCRPGHRRVRVPAPGTGPPPPRTKKACRRPPCRRCAAACRPLSSTCADDVPGVTPASTRPTLPIDLQENRMKS